MILPHDRLGSDQIEISVFGPGYGEAILVGLGSYHWICIDSCFSPGSSAPIAIEYLTGLGLDPSIAIKQLAITHWHDDHTHGMEELFRISRQSSLFCSIAMRERDFHDFLKSHSDLPFMKRPGTTALTRIFHDDMKQRDHRINFIGEFQSVLDRPMQFGAVVAHVKLQSLSPSGTAIRTTMSALSRQFPNPGKRMLAAVIPKDNLLSSAMHLGIGSTNILLGADLEFSSDDNTGWDAVISQDRVYLGKSDIYKVAHHGSATADQQRLWAKLLNPRPVCVICPANKGSYKLPKDSDLERIHTKTDQVYLTYDYRKVGRKRFDQVVEKTLRELGREIVPYVSGFGHVRLRGNVMPNGSVQNWSVLCNESEGE